MKDGITEGHLGEQFEWGIIVFQKQAQRMLMRQARLRWWTIRMMQI